MIEYTSTWTLFVQLNVHDNPIKHWYDGFGWEMANYMSKQVLKQIQTIVTQASFLSLSVDEVTIVDDQFWISVHAYVMHAWKKIPILLTHQHVVEGGNVDKITIVVAQTFM